MLFLPALRDKLSQGDLLSADWDADQPAAIGRAVILSNDCDIDKPESVTVLVCRVTALAGSGRGMQARVRDGVIWHAMHLAGSSPEVWANLRAVVQVPKELLLSRLDRRGQSMTDEGRLLLAVRFFSFLTRTLPPPPPANPVP